MAEYILMPQKGLTEESAILAAWHVKTGDKVKKGDYIFDIETGKAVFSIESETAGVVLATYGEEGDEIPIQQLVAVIGEPGENFDAPASSGIPAATPAEPAAQVATTAPAAQATQPAQAAQTAQAVQAAQPAQAAQTVTPVTAPAGVIELPAHAAGGRIFASPKAKAVAAEKGVDLSRVAGTGPEGRILRDDVLTTAAGAPSALAVMQPAALATIAGAAAVSGIPAASGEPFTIVKNSNIRKTIARNMHDSLQQMAQLTVFASFDATSLLAVRERIKARAAAAANAAKNNPTAKEPVNITVNDMINFAVSRTILDFPTLNAHFNSETTTIFHDVHLGVAVDTKNGLLVPTVFNANKLSLRQIAATSKELAKACQEGKATPQMLSGGTFTTTNLGALRIEAFTPIIAPPQTAIIGIGSIDYKTRFENGEYSHYPAINLSLTFDHRAVDGAPAARFLKALCENLEDYIGLMTE